MTQMIKGDC